jgi:hypothetical protein
MKMNGALMKSYTLMCFTSLALCSGIITGCAAPNPKQSAACERLLSIAEKELDAAKAKGLSSSVSITKAVALISAARIQQQFDKYPNCINKAERARKFIKASASEK